MKKYPVSCGCDPVPKSQLYRCSKCGKNFCGKHIYQYVDESNEAITKNSPLLYKDCYKK
jgi:hypothetical protein